MLPFENRTKHHVNTFMCVLFIFCDFFNKSDKSGVVAGIAARETAQALKTLAQAARGVAASTTDPKAAAAMLDSARNVMDGSALLIHEAKQALISPGDAESQQRLAQVRPVGWFDFSTTQQCYCRMMMLNLFFLISN